MHQALRTPPTVPSGGWGGWVHMPRDHLSATVYWQLRQVWANQILSRDLGVGMELGPREGGAGGAALRRLGQAPARLEGILH